jgi:hypothetical protein
LPNPPGGTGVVYAGKTWQETIEQRFKTHHKGWTDPPFKVVEIEDPFRARVKPGKMTAYETAVWEKHYIEQYRLQNEANGIKFNVNGQQNSLMNDPKANPIGEEAYKDMKKYSFNRPCG